MRMTSLNQNRLYAFALGLKGVRWIWLESSLGLLVLLGVGFWLMSGYGGFSLNLDLGPKTIWSERGGKKMSGGKKGSRI
jgi:hypothetical protein